MRHTDYSELKRLNEQLELNDLARKLALALANEVVYHGEDNCSELSLELLAEARKKLDLSDKFDRLDSLNLRK